MTLEEKESFLMKANYTAGDIKTLLDIGNTQATTIMKELKIKYHGAITGRTNVVKAESFWEREGTSIENELRKLGYAKGYFTAL